MLLYRNRNNTRYARAGNSGEWIVEGTTDEKRAEELLATDFIYQLTTSDGTMLFKKAK